MPSPSLKTTIHAILAPLPPGDALAVVHELLGATLARLQGGACEPPPPREMPPRRLCFRRGTYPVSKIDQDPEIKAYMRAISGPVTIRELRNALIARFGTDRVPSKSALHRYLMKMEQDIRGE